MAPVKYHCTALHLTGDILGKGAFGKVYEGRFPTKQVAIKVNSRDDWQTSQEINRMKRLNHPNIIRLLGVVPPAYHPSRCYCDEIGVNRDITWIVMEYMPEGSLLSYLLDYVGGLPAHGMIKIAYQVACGMWYLHSQANMVHKDLAARNVLVQDSDFNVKIGDFGVECSYDYSSYYYEDARGYKCPIRWMPPENFPEIAYEKGRFTRKGDVWSFGVLLFEIWSRGTMPFVGMRNAIEVMDVVRQGDTVLDYYHIKARRWILDLMEDCFSYDKDERPTFKKIMKTIEDESEYEL